MHFRVCFIVILKSLACSFQEHILKSVLLIYTLFCRLFQEHIKKLSHVITPSHKDLRIPRMYQFECPWTAAQKEIYMINAYKVSFIDQKVLSHVIAQPVLAVFQHFLLKCFFCENDHHSLPSSQNLKQIHIFDLKKMLSFNLLCVF